MFDFKVRKGSDGVLLKLSTVAPRSKRHYEGDSDMVHFNGKFAKDIRGAGFCIYNPRG